MCWMLISFTMGFTRASYYRILKIEKKLKNERQFYLHLHSDKYVVHSLIRVDNFPDFMRWRASFVYSLPTSISYPIRAPQSYKLRSPVAHHNRRLLGSFAIHLLKNKVQHTGRKRLFVCTHWAKLKGEYWDELEWVGFRRVKIQRRPLSNFELHWGTRRESVLQPTRRRRGQKMRGIAKSTVATLSSVMIETSLADKSIF